MNRLFETENRSTRHSGGPARWQAIGAALALVVLARIIAPVIGAQSPNPCGPGGNPIACENSQPGNPPAEWDVAGAGDPALQGFPTDISVNRGQTVRFKINTTATAYRLDIYRLGYYGGLGARKVGSVLPSATLPQPQPACTTDASTGLVDCGVWSESAAWPVPATAVSGVYVARLVRTDALTGASHIVFIVRDDGGASDVLFQTSDMTWQAYNDYGGRSLYTGGPGTNPSRAYKVSYNRPITNRGPTPEDSVFNAEYPMIRWLEANGYNVSYFAGVDGERRGAAILTHKVFLSVGHDEYWSATQRQQVEAARDAGVHLAFFSGNEVFWKVRWEPSIDGSSTANRTLVSYKETHANAKIDPDPAWTGAWADPRFSPPADGGRPQNALSGTLFVANAPATGAINVSDADGKLRLWRNTAVAALAPNTNATLSFGTLGYEWDTDPDSGSRPAGLFRLSSTTMAISQMLLDYGHTYGAGTATHAMTAYRAPSGALVFGAGTVQWSWGLDGTHDRGISTSDASMQQATTNLLADMGVQPATLQPGLFAAQASTDTIAPVSIITSPASGATLSNSAVVLIAGTATDSGGQVAGVEVSTDGGTTWHPAAGRASWTYTWTATAAGPFTIKSRAVDDSGNLQGTPASIAVTVSSGCPCRLWSDQTVPALIDAGDVNAVEVGVKVRSDVDGFISGLRFYKSPANTGVHVGNLWSTSGALLASVTFSGETGSGWQEAALPAPVAVTAGTVYVASYHTTTSHYAYNGAFFTGEYANPPLRAVATSAGGNGVYRYGASGFPNQTYNAGNYWVDVVFTAPAADTTPPTVVSVVPPGGALDVATATAVVVTFSEAMDAARISGSTVQLRDPANALVAATVSYDGATRSATVRPVAPLTGLTTYTVSVQGGSSGVSDLVGNRLASTFTASFTTIDTAAPIVTSIVPGVLFTNVSLTANVTATFSKAMLVSSINSSSFELRDAANQLVPAVVTYDVPTRTATLRPVSPLSSSTAYTAKLYAGAAGVQDIGGNPLAAPFIWSFTTLAGPDVTPPGVIAVSPTGGTTTVAIAAQVTATFSERLDPSTITAATFTLRDAANALVPATVSYDDTTHVATLAPASALTFATAYTATAVGGASGVRDLAGNAMPVAYTWSFTTVAAPSGCPCSIWSDTAAPQQPNGSDVSSVELGLKFRANINGYVHGVRFYKGAANTGVHTGALWTAAGVQLGTLTFGGETASGWQQARFTSSIAITAGTTYVVSYHAVGGRYSYDSAAFATAGVDRGPLHAMADAEAGPNGVYRYGASAFPNQSYNATNYWVDVVFDTTPADTTAPTITAVSPANGTSSVATTTAVTAAFSKAMSPATITTATFELRDAGNALIPATVAYNATTNVATLSPSAALASLATYTARVIGGSGGVADTGGNAMSGSLAWSFTTRDGTPPAITSQSPAPGSTGVSAAALVSAGFSKAMDATTINGATFELRDAANALVPAAVSYNAGSQSAILQPAAALAGGVTYTAKVTGGSSGVKDTAGNALAGNATWSFTVGSLPPPPTCPCQIFDAAAVPGTIATDGSASELGLRFRTTINGFVTGIRFYKGALNTGAHTGSLWTNGGTLLSTVTFSGETASGWQQANLPTPMAVTAGSTYVVSYHTSTGHYGFDAAAFAGSVGSGPVIALADGADGPNGAYRTGASGFPTEAGGGANYWVDVVFNATVAPDVTPPTVSGTAPAAGAGGVATTSPVAVIFSESMDPATVTGTQVRLLDPGAAVVPGTVSYNAGTRTASIVPTSPLAGATVYTVSVSTGAKDLAGNAMAAYSSTFTTGIALTPPDQGPGGPVLVVTTAASPLSRYYAEILRAEGLNAFTVADLASVSAATLAAADVVLLAETPLTAAQVTMFSDYVNAGGNLIAMRPDKQLAGLLGLADAGSTLADKYLLINTASAPGTGLVNQTIQYHGTADRYTLLGASTIATLYSSSITATTNPAVTMNNVGANGGQAVAFTYDLARAIVLMRQGNPAWSGLERDGVTPIRVDDLFFGAATADPQPDWIDLSKVAIPQADEQQRLLLNLIERMNARKKPLPRFWYLPRGLKAAVIMTGDDHGGGGTAARLNGYKAASAAGCSVDDWQCIRSTAYLYPVTPLTETQALAFSADGFEIALHPTTNCNNYSATSLGPLYADQAAQWAGVYSRLAPLATARMHCAAWSDYATQPKVELANGIRLDTSYYYWPGPWVSDRPGMFTGSGFPMRFTDTNGAMINVYQATTQMTDESGQTYPSTVATLLDNALGANGYYGVFTANMHTDVAASAGSDAILAAAAARGVPIVSARQMLDWLDGRNGSSFGSLSWNGNLSFTIAPAAGVRGLQAMLPTRPAVGGLDSLSRNGVPVSYTLQTIKGIEYALFAADAGAYLAVFDTTPPVTSIIGQPGAFSNSTSATFAFAANELSTYVCRLDAGAFAPCTSPLTYTGLAAGSHTFSVKATDRVGNVEPSAVSAIWTIDLTPPSIVSKTPAAGATAVALQTPVTVTFTEPMSPASLTTATFRLRRVGAASDLPAAVSFSGNTASLTPAAPLALGGISYQAVVAGTATDRAGNTLGPDTTWTFTTAAQVKDTTTTDFAAGTVGAGAAVVATSDGEVTLAPTAGAEFSGTALPADWTNAAWSSGGAATVASGTVALDGARTATAALFTPGRTLEFAANFSGDGFQHAGFGLTLNETPWAIFSTQGGGSLYARTHNGATQNNTLIPGSWLGAMHRFRIDWNAASVDFFIDGTLVASHAITINVSMRPIASDLTVGAGKVTVDWMRLTPYAASGTFTSGVFDAGGSAAWGALTWTSTTPAGTGMVISVRTGSTPTPDGTWSAFTVVASSGGAVGASSRYVQYRAQLSSTAANQTPVLSDVTIGGVVP